MLTLLKFEADWCGPCQQVKPVVNKLAQQYKDTLNVKTIDVDLPEHRELVMHHGIRSIPAFVLTESESGEENVLGTLGGAVSYPKLAEFVETHLQTAATQA